MSDHTTPAAPALPTALESTVLEPVDAVVMPKSEKNRPVAAVEYAQAAMENVASTVLPTAAPSTPVTPATASVTPEQVYQFTDIVSGQFDADEEVADLAPPKRVLAPMPESPKLHKVLAQSGLGSRLEMEALILEGRISVNNAPAHIGQRVQWGDQVKVNGRLLKIRIDPPPARVIAYHKPTGEVVTHDDPQNRPTVFRRLPKLYQGKWQSVGRLDLNTEGLLLFTNSGELANRLMHPRFGLEREYAVRVLGALNAEEKQKLLDGVQLEDGFAQFGSIEEGGGEGSNHWYRVTISEGRNREVRRMVEAVGHAVSRLIRIRYGAMMLPRGLKRGASMELDDADIRALVNAAGGPGDAAPREWAARGDGQGGQPQRGARNGARSDARNDGRGNETRGNDERGNDGRGNDRRGNEGRSNTRGPRNLRNGRRNQGPNPNRQNGGDLDNQQPGFVPNPAPQQGQVQPQTPRDANDYDDDNHSQAGVSHENGFARPQQRGNRGGGRGGNAGGGRGGGGPGPGPGNFNNNAGGGNFRGKSGNRNPNPGGGGQPDPLRTTQGYIGADSLQRQRAAPPGGGRGGRGGARGRSGGR